MTKLGALTTRTVGQPRNQRVVQRERSAIGTTTMLKIIIVTFHDGPFEVSTVL